MRELLYTVLNISDRPKFNINKLHLNTTTFMPKSRIHAIHMSRVKKYIHSLCNILQYGTKDLVVSLYKHTLKILFDYRSGHLIFTTVSQQPFKNHNIVAVDI